LNCETMMEFHADRKKCPLFSCDAVELAKQTTELFVVQASRLHGAAETAALQTRPLPKIELLKRNWPVFDRVEHRPSRLISDC